MNIKISKQALKKLNLDDIISTIYEEIEYHLLSNGQLPNKITVIRYYEDHDKLTPTTSHMVLTL